MKQPLTLPNKLYEQLLKRKKESSRMQSPVEMKKEKIDALKKERPNSSICGNLSTAFDVQNDVVNKSNSVSILLKKIKSEKLFNKEQLQRNSEMIEKQYQKLIELAKKKPLLIKGPRSMSNPDIVIPQNYNIKVYGKSQGGTLYGGENKVNQDVFKIIRNFIQKDWYFQVSDGHGQNGHQVAQFIKESLPQIIQNKMTENKSIDRILIESFKKTNDQLSKSGIDVKYSGATTVIVLIKDNEIICANIGDSRAILGRKMGKLQLIELSKDHKPDCFLEQTRILNRGGRVQAYCDEDGNPIGPARVWLKNEDVPGLAMSRSFGDAVASKVGVICEPEIIRHRILPCDQFLIIASDGVWEYLTNEQVIKVVQEYNDDPIKACNKIIEMAQKVWQQEDEVIDDITIIIAYINN